MLPDLSSGQSHNMHKSVIFSCQFLFFQGKKLPANIDSDAEEGDVSDEDTGDEEDEDDDDDNNTQANETWDR